VWFWFAFPIWPGMVRIFSCFFIIWIFSYKEVLFILQEKLLYYKTYEKQKYIKNHPQKCGRKHRKDQSQCSILGKTVCDTSTTRDSKGFLLPGSFWHPFSSTSHYTEFFGRLAWFQIPLQLESCVMYAGHTQCELPSGSLLKMFGSIPGLSPTSQKL
jgi:hypothetical protein